MLLVVETDGQVVGGIEYHEEDDPMYRQAGIDIYLGARAQGQGLGTEAVALLARFLREQRGHHRLTIDPAAANHRATRCYEKAGFRRVGRLRQYERPGRAVPRRPADGPAPARARRGSQLSFRAWHPWPGRKENRLEF